MAAAFACAVIVVQMSEGGTGLISVNLDHIPDINWMFSEDTDFTPLFSLPFIHLLIQTDMFNLNISNN